MSQPIQHLKDLVRDGGWKSRKLALTVFTQILIFVGAILASKFGLITGSYDIMVGGLLAALTVFLTGNVYQNSKMTAQIGGVVAQMSKDQTPPKDPPKGSV